MGSEMCIRDSVSCGNGSSECLRINSDYHFLMDNPLTASESALKSKDYLFLSVQSHNILVPGVPLNCINIDSDVRNIFSYSDKLDDYENEIYEALSIVYASRYNTNVLNFMLKNNSLTCKPIEK